MGFGGFCSGVGVGCSLWCFVLICLVGIIICWGWIGLVPRRVVLLLLLLLVRVGSHHVVNPIVCVDERCVLLGQQFYNIGQGFYFLSLRFNHCPNQVQFVVKGSCRMVDVVADELINRSGVDGSWVVEVGLVRATGVVDGGAGLDFKADIILLELAGWELGTDLVEGGDYIFLGTSKADMPVLLTAGFAS